MLLRSAPVLFVVLWSTGFIFSKLGMPYAEPFTFLAVRMLLTLALLVPFCLWVRAPWPGRRLALHAGVSGGLIHGIYLAGTLVALQGGMPTGTTALIVSLQPVVTALVAAPLLGERVTRWHWAGLGLGLTGAALVIGPRLELPIHAAGTGVNFWTIAAALASLAGITAGTLYHKRFAQGGDLRTVTVCQFAGAGLLTGLAALSFETREIAWTREFVFALVWLVLVLSLGAVSLLMLMIRENALSRVAALFYLVPGVTALMAAGLFGERLAAIQIVGMTLTAGAVLLIARLGQPAPTGPAPMPPVVDTPR